MNDQTKDATVPVDQIAGGQCTAQDIVSLTTQLTDAYESLVDFTSHVMERVLGP